MAKQTDKAIMESLESARIEYEHMQRIAILSGYTFPTKPSKDGIYRIYVSDPSKKSGRLGLVAGDIIRKPLPQLKLGQRKSHFRI